VCDTQEVLAIPVLPYGVNLSVKNAKLYRARLDSDINKMAALILTPLPTHV
jgi:hypothetical protein